MPEDDLEPLITECPGCRTRFRVSEDQLQRARGRVRCGACLTVFNGVEHLDGVTPQALDQGAASQTLDDLLDELTAQPPRQAPVPPEVVAPAPDIAELEATPPPKEAPRSKTGVQPMPQPRPRPQPQQVVAKPSISAVAAVPAQEAEPPPAAAPEAAPAGAVSAQPMPAAVVFGEPRRRRPWLWLGVPVGVLLLAAQVLWLRFDDWSADPFWRGVYAPLCGVLGCELPVQRDIGALGTRQLAVRSHPDQPGALLVSAVIVNEAEFAQPFPMLELRFTTPRGLLVAGRRFAPAEYLSGDARGMTRFPPRTPVQIELTIDDPGPDAVNYFLRFR
jgi:predicted Zn finger-like uncharacterized protein